MNAIQLPDDKSYPLDEVIELVQLTLDAVQKETAHNKLRYSAEDVYWLLHDMLRYINRNVPGEYALHRMKNGAYRVTYVTEDAGTTRAKNELKTDVRNTADYLAKLTGRRPPWG